MPLVRISGGDAASFDTFDVAEMADGRDQRSQRNWSSRQSGSGPSAANSRQAAKHALSQTPETDDDSSSGRRSEEADRLGSIPSRGIPAGRYSQSSLSVGSMNSYYTGNSSTYDNVQTSAGSYNSHVPLYQTVDNLDEMQQDPRNPFNKSHDTTRTSWGENIPEEDETSLSTMEDSSVSPSVQQQQSSQYQNPHSRPISSQQMHQPQQRSHRQRQKQQQPSSIMEDDVSVLSYQSSSQNLNRRSTMSDNSSHIISQLEAQVMKLNFELATTKSSLDELQLENRRLSDDKDKLTNNLTLLHEENDQLNLKIERLEREKILRNMEGTKGAARAVTDRDTWGGLGGSESVTSANRAYVPVTKQRLGKVGGGLEVPFRTAESDYHLRPKRLSLSSVNSFNDLSTDGDNTSRGDVDCQSAHSVALSESEYNMGSGDVSENEDLGQAAQRTTRDLLANVFGAGKKQPVKEMTKQMDEATISSSSRRNEEDEIAARRLSSEKRNSHLQEDENDVGSNPQGEDFNDDDPFATWSAAGDPKREEPDQNWLQRGLGGRGRNGNKRQPPQSKDVIEDPFDTCNQSSDDEEDDEDGKYTSFADKTSDDRPPGSNSVDGDSGAQERKRFGLFRLGGRR